MALSPLIVVAVVISFTSPTVANQNESDSSTNQSTGTQVVFTYEQNQVLVEHTLDAVVKYIKEKNCKNIITITGAGTSTSAGIPDYDYLKAELNITDPSINFSYDLFMEEPYLFYSFIGLMNPKNRIPTRTHYFIRLLQEKGILLRHYTKNIDTLDRKAGIVPEKLVEIYGSLHNSYCLNCSAEYNQKWMEEKLEYGKIPRCEQCAGIVKPDIDLYGNKTARELISKDWTVRSRVIEYEEKFWHDDKYKCDLLIIIGCNIGTYPIDTWTRMMPENVPRLLIDKKLTGQLYKGTSLEAKGFDFNPMNNSRDAFWEGICDDGCQLLADKLGWDDELKHLMEEGSMTIKTRPPIDPAD